MTDLMDKQARTDRECLLQLSQKAMLTMKGLGTHWDYRYLVSVLNRAAHQTLTFRSLEKRCEAMQQERDTAQEAMLAAQIEVERLEGIIAAAGLDKSPR